jgi:hypothetical protein
MGYRPAASASGVGITGRNGRIARVPSAGTGRLMHQRTVTCDCGVEPFPLSNDEVTAVAEIVTFLNAHSHHPDVRKGERPRAGFLRRG